MNTNNDDDNNSILVYEDRSSQRSKELYIISNILLTVERNVNKLSIFKINEDPNLSGGKAKLSLLTNQENLKYDSFVPK